MDAKKWNFFVSILFLGICFTSLSSCRFNFSTKGDKKEIEHGVEIDPELSSIEGTKEGSSVTSAEVTITLKSIHGYPVKGFTPSFTVTPKSPHDSNFTCGVTDINGKAICSFQSLDTEIKKNLHITYPVSKTGGYVRFIRAASMFEELVAPTQAKTKSMEELEDQPLILLKDPLGIPVSNDNETSIFVKLKTIESTTSGLASLFKNGVRCLPSGCAVKPINGRIDFALPENRLSVNHSGNFALIYTAENVQNLESSSFNIQNGSPHSISFFQEPSSKVSTVEVFPQQPIIAIMDSQGNLVTKNASGGSQNAFVELSLEDPNNTNAELVGSTRQSFSNGLADFSTNSIRVETNKNSVYIIKARTTINGEVFTAASRTFRVSLAGLPSILSFFQQPSVHVTNDSIFLQQPIVQLLDVDGNLATTDSTTKVLLSLSEKQSGDDLFQGISGSTPPTSQTARVGQVYFTNLRIKTDLSGTLYKNFSLRACVAENERCKASPDIQDALSTNIRVERAGRVPTKLTWMEEPAATGRSQIIKSSTGGSLKVAILDGKGNVVTIDNSSIITITKKFGQGELSGTKTKTVAAGIAIFDDLRLNTLGAHTLEASSPGLEKVSSRSFYVNTNGSPSRIRFLLNDPLCDDNAGNIMCGPRRAGESEKEIAGVSFKRATVVAVQDESGNLVDSVNGGTVTLGCTVPENCELLGEIKTNVLNGYAIFPKDTLFIENSVGRNIEIKATSSAYGEDTYRRVLIDPDSPDLYQSSIAGSPPSTPGRRDGLVVVVVKDQFGNPRFNEDVEIDFEVNNGGSDATPITCNGKCSNTNRAGEVTCPFSCKESDLLVTVKVTKPTDISDLATVIYIPPPPSDE